MPLFLVPMAIGAVTLLGGGAGVKKGIDGKKDLSDAKERRKKATERLERHNSILQSAARHLEQRHDALTALRTEVEEITVPRLIELMAKLDQSVRAKAMVQLEALEDIDSSAKFDSSAGHVAPKRHVAALEAMVQGGMMTAGVSSTLAAAAAQLGAASTGAAISGLSGAAAQSATMAWLGGGALSAGGGGMALGTLVSGGAMAGVAVAAGGFALARQGAKELTAAVEYESGVKVETQKLNTRTKLIHEAEKRYQEVIKVHTSLAERVETSLDSLEDSITSDEPDEDTRATVFALTLMLSKSLVDLCRVQVLNKKGNPSSESAKAIKQHKALSE